MATTEPRATSAGSLQETARRHLWLHFSRMGAYSDDAEIPIIVRGEGCYLWDEHGNRYFDGLSALFCSNIGHGRQEVGQAGADQAGELEFVTNWSYAHPQAISSRPASPISPRATSTASSSRAAAARRSSPRSSCRASSTSSTASR